MVGELSSRWAGAITKASDDQWAPACCCQVVHLVTLDAGIATIGHRLSLPVAAEGGKGAPGGYRSRQEWHAKTRRLAALAARRAVGGGPGRGGGSGSWPGAGVWRASGTTWPMPG